MVMGEILKKIDALGGIITEAGIKYASRLVLLLILLSTAGCNRRSSVDKKMDLADSLMMSKPDSALMNNLYEKSIIDIYNLCICC